MYGRVSEGSPSDPSPEWTAPGGETGLEGAMWRLGIGGGETYPERPNEPDCIFYLRTGFCGYGSRCRFNHPPDRGAVLGGAAKAGGGEFPERSGQPVCQYYMRTGTCKFGASCKYHHPRHGGGSANPVSLNYLGYPLRPVSMANPVSLNYLGYPLRPGEKECSYYMKTGQCKFGATCKFHHPAPPGMQIQPPSPAGQVLPAPAPVPGMYPTVPSAPSSQQYGVVSARPQMLTGSYVQSPYGPLLLSPSMVPFPGWSPYPASVNVLPSPGTQPAVGSSSMYGMAPLSPSAPAYSGAYPSGVSSVVTGSGQKELLFPQRPGQPDCQYYMRTGDCKFGSSCRYHHPLEVIAPQTGVILSPIGLPIRPGAPPCSHYTQHGICKFGPACRFDHPMGTLSYSPSASSLTDMPVAPYPIGSSIGTLAPSSTSTDLRPELISGSGKDPILTKTSTAMASSSGTAVPVSKGESISESNVPESGQSSGPANGSSGSAVVHASS